ncbi:MAG: glycoside hydrolase family 97 catalytic domain-containing protein [Kiritimatiellae bacterium]|nr:glycoside hydrolase family 97 catalytic domain-containing protein [Kiritimatiellia bacterium]
MTRMFIPKALAVAFAFGCMEAEAVKLSSPDGRLVAEIDPPSVSLSYDGAKVVDVKLSQTGSFGTPGAVSEHRGEWENSFGERKTVRDDYNSIVFSGTTPFEVRCYDAGFAWRGTTDEGTEYVFGGDWKCWPVSHAQGHYEPFKLSNFDTAREMPHFALVAAGIGEMRNYETVTPGSMEAPFVVEGDTFVASLGEAANTNFAKLRYLKGKQPHSVISHLEGPEAGEPDADDLPWRYVRIAKTPCELYAGNDIVLNLNEPSKIKDTSWIKPGKVLRVAKLDEETGKEAVDFVAANGLDYIELDAGWYGQEHTGNPREPRDFVRPVIDYATSRGVGTLLYVNREPLKRTDGGIDEILPELKSWGVKGIKYGFVNVGAQKWNKWVSEAVRKGAEYGLMLDMHDEYRLTGNQRTWPNVMTVEGIRGNEEMPDASHNAALIFTRYLAGPGDYTPCWKISRVKNSLAHQLALGVATFSPWQFLFWYQRPEQIDAGNPALEIWKEMPTVWDETVPVAGEIGEYAIIARKAADGAWFAGALNANKKRTLELPLSFLGEGEWRMTLCRDENPDATNALAAVKVERKTVCGQDLLKVECSAHGGFAAMFKKVMPKLEKLPNGGIWPDTEGRHINAHGAGIIRDGGKFYMFGEHKIAGKAGNRAWVGVRCYSSEDLVNWQNEGIALTIGNKKSDIAPGCILERPKVAKAKNGKYVMYFHLERKGMGYTDARTGVAVSDNITGPYKFIKSLRPNAGEWPRSIPEDERTPATLARYASIPQPWGGTAKLWGAHFKDGQMSRDMTLYTDDDGTIYHIFASEDNSTLHVATLSDDGLSYTGEWERISHGDWTEAPCVVKRDGWYYLLGSGCTGWRPNDARYYRAKSLFGPWERMGNPAKGVNPANKMGPDKTWGGQSTAIVKVGDAAYALFDLWQPSNAIDGRYAFLPIAFDDKTHTISIEWKDEWRAIKPDENKKESSPSKEDRLAKFAAEGDDALAARLFMHWNTRAKDVLVKDEAVVGTGPDKADVPTVMLNGNRSHPTQYLRPSIEELPLRHEDPRGLFLKPKDGGAKTWVPYGKTGSIISSVNREILSLACKAADKYPTLAFNTLDTYLRGILARNVPTDMNRGHMQTLFGMQSMETIHDSTLEPSCSLYKALKPYIEANCPQNKAIYDAALKKWAEVQIANGVADNNWDIIQLNNILSIALTLESDGVYADKKGREHYIDVVMNKSSVRNLSLRDLCAKGFDDKTGIWWECPGYSIVTLKELAKIADRLKEEAGIDVFAEIPVLKKAFSAAGEYLYPDGMLLGFGDTHPAALPAEITRIAAPRTSPFFYAPNASWLAARSGMNPTNDIAFALNAALGNHMHANGISLELYAKGYRIAPDAGIGWSLYSGDDYKEYYSRYPAHNTVMVNSCSDFSPMKCHHPFQLEAHGDNWASVSMRDPATGAEQKRTVGYVKKGKAAYFVDCFRSRIPGNAKGANEWHDYYYHNFGDTVEFDGETQPTETINFAESGLYALSYIKDKEVRKGEGDLKAAFPWKRPEGKLETRFFMNGAKGRTFIKAFAPATEGLSRVKSPDYAITPESRTPVIVARQLGEAWDTPFLAVIDPSGEVENVGFKPDSLSLDVKLKDGEIHHIDLAEGWNFSSSDDNSAKTAPSAKEQALLARIPSIVALAKSQYALLDSEMAKKPTLAYWKDGRKTIVGDAKNEEWIFPRSWTRGTYKVESATGWTTGFFPGSLWLLYALSGDEDFKTAAEKWTPRLESAKNYTRNHDMGFMFFCSYGNGIKYGGHGDDYKNIIFSASRALAKRWNDSLGIIRSWDEPKFMQCPVIIDSMMNLEMLQWAAKNGAGAHFDEMSRKHADKLDSTHFRTNNTAYHVTDWNPKTGKIWARYAWQGACVDGAWARGQGWSIYGYTMMYRETRDKRYLDRAVKTAEWILSAPNLPEDKIPYWDYFAADIPYAPRDASAAAIMASGLIELAGFVPQEKAKRYRNFAVDMLASLASDEYLAKKGECGGFLLKHSTGHYPENTEIDASINYADYYFLEALLRLAETKR